MVRSRRQRELATQGGKKGAHGPRKGKGLAFTLLFTVAVMVVAGWVFPASWNRVMPAAIAMPERDFRLGLDLVGGAHLVYEADMQPVAASDRASALEGVREVVERRVNAMGVSEATVQSVVSGDASRILVDLPGVSDVREAVKSIGETPVLTFAHPVETTPADTTATPDAQAARDAAKQQANDVLARVKKGESLASLVPLSQGPQKDQDGLSGWVDEFDARVKALPKGAVKGTLIPTVVEKGSSYAVAELADTRQANEWNFAEMVFCFAGAPQCDGATRTREEATALAQSIQQTVTPDTFASVADAQSDTPKGSSERGWVRQSKVEVNEAFALVKMAVNETRITDVGGRVALVLKRGARGYAEYQFREVEFMLPGTEVTGGVSWALTELSGKHVKNAVVEFDRQTGAPHVSLTFNSEGADLFAEITKEYIGQRIAIFLDGAIISAPLVQQEILGGQAVITNIGSLPDAKALAQRLRAGALPVPISLVSQQSIGPSLGAASLDESLRAAYLGLILVAGFMLLMYRLPGLVAVMALAVYTVLVLAIFKGLPVTLTLPGLAGFVLSIGIAVDANVLIFERLKEEWRAGKAPTQAVNDAFARAWTAIRDGNMTTIFSCVILYALTTGFIQGFALTLLVGVLVSMFSAVMVTRWVMRAVVRVPFLRRPWFLGL
jgi:protein-export membrane protein SecD